MTSRQQKIAIIHQINNIAINKLKPLTPNCCDLALHVYTPNTTSNISLFAAEKQHFHPLVIIFI
jgi:hypothetical protein